MEGACNMGVHKESCHSHSNINSKGKNEFGLTSPFNVGLDVSLLPWPMVFNFLFRSRPCLSKRSTLPSNACSLPTMSDRPWNKQLVNSEY